VKSTGKPDTAENNINVHKGAYNLIEWNYLTDTNNWFLMRLRHPQAASALGRSRPAGIRLRGRPRHDHREVACVHALQQRLGRLALHLGAQVS
jgi:hypothetical protein